MNVRNERGAPARTPRKSNAARACLGGLLWNVLGGQPDRCTMESPVGALRDEHGVEPCRVAGHRPEEEPQSLTTLGRVRKGEYDGGVLRVALREDLLRQSDRT